jgi:amino acid adenylation domain-containing protein
LRYSTDLFDSSTITRMLGHFETLLQGIVSDPRQRLSELPLLSAAEKQQLLVEWNDTARPFPQESCIHHLFEEQVERTPDVTALSYEGEQVSYAELNARANRLAHYLRAQGVGPEVLVGICLERSVELVVSLLAVLKAGGAYVPLDPSYPQQRLSYMLQDAGVSLLLTESHLVDWPLGYTGRVLYVDRAWEPGFQKRVALSRREALPDNLAYVIYTSGSTGAPKGVQIKHRSVTNFLHSLHVQLEITDSDILLAVTSLSFDIAALELFLPLMVGAEIVLATREMASNGALLINTIERFDITIMQATPATWRLLVEAGWQSSRSLKKLCGGEALPPQLATGLLDVPGPLWNLYGPTETTIWSAVYHVRSTDNSGGPIPLGNPIANTQIYVLDKYLHAVAIGVPGELYIGGEGLARGYFNLPGLTAERFIPSPFSEKPGERLYRTGDLVCYQADGCIELLGRMDHQVKIRGFRIELGEIEFVLSSHQSVSACVAISREDSPGDARLIAYIIATTGTTTTSSELRSHVARNLPDYMVPSAFVILDELPLTPNGKLDRKALPAPDREHDNSPGEYVAPSTPLEQTIADIWAQVLRLGRIGIYDNFFEIGGHSLLATQIISRMREALQVELPLRALFEHPTVASIVSVVTDSQCAAGETGSLMMSSIHRGHVDLDQLLAELDQLSEDEVRLLISDEMQLTERLGVIHE